MIDESVLVNREQAAALVGVSPHTIDTWVKRGNLVRMATAPGRGRPVLYRLGDVINAERKSFRRAKRRLARRPQRI